MQYNICDVCDNICDVCDGTHYKKSPWPNKMENQIKIRQDQKFFSV